MKKSIILSLIFLFIFTSLCYADFLDLKIGCEDNYCVPNRITNWNLTLNNLGQRNLEILGFKIVSAIEKKEIAFYEKEKPIEITPSNYYTFSVDEKIPPPEEKNRLDINVCLIEQPPQESWGTTGKRTEHCYNELNFSIITTECTDSTDCGLDQTCIDFMCVLLNCSYCQFPDKHQCNNYECCKTDECEKDKICENKECKKINCSPEEYIINHTCTTTLCAFNEGIINFTCSPIKCAPDEIIVNHNCTVNTCNYDEYIFNYTCKHLNCTYDSTPVNHSCTPLNCSSKESYINNACKNLQCNFIQKPEGHECRFNSNILIYAFFIFMIYFLIKLNIEKSGYIKRKKLYEYFLNKLNLKKGENIKTGEVNKQKEVKNDRSGNTDRSKGEQGKN
jgi:hypothetical protein